MACPEQKVRVALDMEKMSLMNITIDLVMNAVVSNNANIPGGAIKISDKSFGIKTSGAYQNLEEIKNTVVNSYEGRIIYLKNIANVNFEYEDDNYLARVNGKKAIFITVNQKEGRNIFETKEQIDKVLAKFESGLDKDIQVAAVFEQSVDVFDRVNGFLTNMLQGGNLGLFMLVFGLAMIFIISPILTYFYGKRWYCSWVCGCGGLAETAGDSFRHLSISTQKAWKIERWLIHSVLVFSFVTTIAVIFTFLSNNPELSFITKNQFIYVIVGFLIVFTGALYLFKRIFKAF